MKKRFFFYGGVLFVVFICLFLIVACSNRKVEAIVDERMYSDYVVNEDIPADYYYLVSLVVDGKRIVDGTTIENHEGKLQNILTIDEFYGNDTILGVAVYIDGIPTKFRLEDKQYDLYTFNPKDIDTIEFSIDISEMKLLTGKISVCILSELNDGQVYYLETIHQYTNVINYIIAGDHETDSNNAYVIEAQNCSFDDLNLNASNLYNTNDLLSSETNGLVCGIADSIGVNTVKYLDNLNTMDLYLNVYGTPGEYIAVTYYNDKLYQGFGESCYAHFTVQEGQLSYCSIMIPDDANTSIIQLYCVIIPISIDNHLIYDTPKVHLIDQNNISISEAASVYLNFDVYSKETQSDSVNMTTSSIDCVLEMTSIGMERNLRMFCLINDVPQTIIVNQDEIDSYLFSSSADYIEFSICPNVTCEYGSSFVVDVYLINEGTECIYSEDYMIDYAFDTKMKSITVTNQYKSIEQNNKDVLISDTYLADKLYNGLSQIYPTQFDNCSLAYNSFFRVYSNKINLTYLFSGSNYEETYSGRYLTFMIMNGEIQSVFGNKKYLLWNNQRGTGLKFDFNVKLSSGINELYFVTIPIDASKKQQHTNRIRIEYVKDAVYCKDIVFSSAIGIDNAVLYLKKLSADNELQYSASIYGFNYDRNIDIALDSYTRNINRNGEIQQNEINQIMFNHICANSLVLSCVVESNGQYMFVKYKTYGYTN